MIISKSKIGRGKKFGISIYERVVLCMSIEAVFKMLLTFFVPSFKVSCASFDIVRIRFFSSSLLFFVCVCLCVTL